MNYHDPNSYPINAFPPDLARLIRELLRLTMTPSALPGMSVLTALSVSCQGLIDVRLPIAGEPLRPVSLNLLLIGESGERRSAVDSMVCAPIYAHDEDAAKEHEANLRLYREERETWQMVKKGLQRQITRSVLSEDPNSANHEKLMAHLANEPKAPRLRRIIRQNSTVRATFEALQGNGESIAFMTDEGQILFDSSMMRNLGLSNKLWDGARVLTLDRARLDNIVVLNPRATYAIMTHEAVLKKYLAKHGDEALGSGHWARYLIANPPSTKGFRIEPDDNSCTSIELPPFHKRISQLLEAYAKKRKAGNFDREELRFNEEATEYWRETYRKVEQDIKPGCALSDISDFASKYMEIMSRIAALFHYFCLEEEKDITISMLQRAESIVWWHMNEYQRLLGGGPSHQKDADDLLHFLHRRYWLVGINTILPSTLLHEGPARLRTKWRRDETLHVLDAVGAIRIEYENPLRRTKPRIILNDAFFAGFQGPIAA